MTATENQITAWLEVEKLDSYGNTIGCYELLITGEIERGTPDVPHGDLACSATNDVVYVISATDSDGGDEELSREDEKRAEEALIEAFADRDRSRHD